MEIASRQCKRRTGTLYANIISVDFVDRLKIYLVFEIFANVKK